jgi:anti-sigma regulatory factor (Ser/Thr protein kinase)
MVRARLGEWGIDGDAEDVSLLLVSELVTNAVLHSRPPLRLLAVCDGACLRVEVHDGDRASAPTLRRTHDELAEGDSAPGGRGLKLVEALASRWGSREYDGGKLVWFELDL